MTPAFADANYYIALLSPRDGLHEIARRFDEQNPDQDTITTDIVLSEVFAYFADAGEVVRTSIVKFVDRLRIDTRVTLIHQSAELFFAGVDLYRRRLDKAYSLVDCVSMVVCSRLRITDVLTADRHFEQEGFHRLLV